MNWDGVEVGAADMGGITNGITIWAGADPEFGAGAKAGSGSKTKSKAKSTAAGEGARSTLESIEGMTAKELGELAEAEFLRRALGMGMAVTKPWGESQAYDFIVDAEGKLSRVQVKAAFREGPKGGYSLRAYRSSKKCYTKKRLMCWRDMRLRRMRGTCFR